MPPEMEHLQEDEKRFDEILQLLEQAKQDPSVIDQIIQIVSEMKSKDEGEEKQGEVEETGLTVKGSKPSFEEKLQKVMAQRTGG